MCLLTLFGINSLVTDTPKRSGIQKKKIHLMDTIALIFDAPKTGYDS